MRIVNHVLDKKKDFASIEQIASACVDNIEALKGIGVKLTDKFDQHRPKPIDEKKTKSVEPLHVVLRNDDLTSDIMAKIGFNVGDSVVHKDSKTCRMKITTFATIWNARFTGFVFYRCLCVSLYRW